MQKKIAKRRPAFRLMWKFLTRKNLKRGDAWVKVTCWRKTKSFFLATAVQVHIGFMEWCFANNKSLLPLIACHDYLSTNYIEGNGEDGVISSVFLFKQAWADPLVREYKWLWYLHLPLCKMWANQVLHDLSDINFSLQAMDDRKIALK